MLAFHYHIVLSLALLALALGAAILIWAKVHENLGTSLAKFIAYIIIILSVPNIICASYYGLKYWTDGYMDKPYPSMMQSQMSRGGMMMPCPMMQHPMMQGGMMGGQMPNQMPQKQQLMNQSMPNPTETSQMPQRNLVGTPSQSQLSPAENSAHHATGS